MKSAPEAKINSAAAEPKLADGKQQGEPEAGKQTAEHIDCNRRRQAPNLRLPFARLSSV